MTSVITTPVSASQIKQQFSYFIDKEGFDLERYRGMPLVYPDYWRDSSGNIKKDRNGDPIQFRKVPLSGKLSFSDFLGAAGYFQPYPSPTITQTVLLGSVKGYSNVGEISHSAEFKADAQNSLVPFWRPAVTSIQITAQWQRTTSGQPWSNYGAAETKSVGPTGTAAFTRSDSNSNSGTYTYRILASATSFAPNDDLVPGGGAIGAERQINTVSLTSNAGETILSAYQPPQPTASASDGVWNEATADATPREGHYAILIREVDDVVLQDANPVLSFPRGISNVKFSPAPGRGTPVETTTIEWQFFNSQNPRNPGWQPVSELNFTYADSPYDDNDYGITFTDTGISMSGLDDVRYDAMQFRAKITATQELFSPSETNTVTAYTDVYSLDITTALSSPTYSLTGTSGVVNGGTFTFKFVALNIGTRDYTYSLADPQGDFVPADITGNFTASSKQEIDFSISTVLDGDTSTEAFTLNITDDESGEVVANKVINIIYGEQKWYFTSGNATIGEEDSTELKLGGDNVGDDLVYVRYTRTIADSTGPNDFKVNGTLLTQNTWTPVQLSTSLLTSNNSVIKSTGAITVVAVKDSQFGGAVDNLEKFRFDLKGSDGTVHDSVNVTVLDKLTYQLNVFGSVTNNTVVYDVVETAANRDVAPGTAKIAWIGTPRFHVSTGTETNVDVYYQWQYKHPSVTGNSWYGFNTGEKIISHSQTYELTAFPGGTIKMKPGYQLEFTIGTKTWNNAPLSEYTWRVRARARAANGTSTASAFTTSGRMSVIENYSYIKSGIKWVSSNSLTEGTTDSVKITVRTASSIGADVTVQLSDPQRTGYLIDFPKFGPIRPHQTPVAEKTLKVTADTITFDMGAWLYHAYGYQQNEPPTAYNSSSKKYMRATATLTKLSVDQTTGAGIIPVSDTSTKLRVRTPQSTSLTNISLKPGDSFDLNFTGTNLRAARAASNTPWRFGMGFYIIGNNGGSIADRIADAQSMFTPQDTVELASGSTPADTAIWGENYLTPLFSKQAEIASSDYFTMAYGKKEGIYTTSFSTVKVKLDLVDKYFEPKSYTIVPTSHTAGTMGTYGITVYPIAEPEPQYSIKISPVEPQSKIYVESSRGYRLIIEGEKPADLNHTYTFWGAGSDIFEGPNTDTIRLTHHAGTPNVNDVITMTPKVSGAGKSFYLTVKNSAGDIKGQEQFTIEELADYSVSISPIGQVLPNTRTAYRAVIIGGPPLRDAHKYFVSHRQGTFLFNPNNPNGSINLDWQPGTPNLNDKFYLTTRAGTAGESFTVGIRDFQGIVKGSTDITIGNAPLTASVTNIAVNVPPGTPPPGGYSRTAPSFYFRREKIDAGDWDYRVVWDGKTVFSRQYIDYSFPPTTVRGTDGYNYTRGSAKGSFYYGVSSNAPVSTDKPSGSAKVTASGGSGSYTYKWSYELTEGQILTANASGDTYTLVGFDGRTTGVTRCTVTDSDGVKKVVSGTIKFNHDRQPSNPPDPPQPDPTPQVTLAGTYDARQSILQGDDDDGYVEDRVSASISGGSGSYDIRWSFTNRNSTLVRGLNGSKQTNVTSYRLGVSGANGLAQRPAGTVGVWSGTVTCTVTDRNYNTVAKASTNVYFAITVIPRGGPGGPGSPGDPPNLHKNQLRKFDLRNTR